MCGSAADFIGTCLFFQRSGAGAGGEQLDRKGRSGGRRGHPTPLPCGGIPHTGTILAHRSGSVGTDHSRTALNCRHRSSRQISQGKKWTINCYWASYHCVGRSLPNRRSSLEGVKKPRCSLFPRGAHSSMLVEKRSSLPLCCKRIRGHLCRKETTHRVIDFFEPCHSVPVYRKANRA